MTVFLDTVGLLAVWYESDQWHLADGYAPEAALKSMSRIKEILEEGDRLAIAFWMHDGIFHALLTDREVCAKVREACQKNEMLSFTFDAKLRILSIT
jgi:predicted metal-dependent HD superfamily phosphohydrolase